MDPTANLKQQIHIATKISVCTDKGGTPNEDDVAVLAELVLALDEWIKKGGFLPEPWQQKP